MVEEEAARVENIELDVNVIGNTAYLRDDIMISDIIVETATKPYYTQAGCGKQERTYSPAPDIKIRLAICFVIAFLSCCSLTLAEIALPFGCMVQPLSWGGFSRLVKEKKMETAFTIHNVVTEIQVPIVASALVHVIMRTQKYNATLYFIVLCASMAWLGSCSNSFAWSPSYLNCDGSFVPRPDALGPGTIAQLLCNSCFLLFAIRRMLLVNQAVTVFPAYDTCVRVMICLAAVFGFGAVAVRESFGRVFDGILYYVAGVFLSCTLALALVLFSEALRKLRSADLSTVDPAMDGMNRAVKILQRERFCISLTMLTTLASTCFTGTQYLSTALSGQDSFFGSYERLKYVMYSVDTMVSTYCFAYLMLSSEERIVGFDRIQHASQ
jgi:hypothetical protein